jgi:Flp pilus assembly protein TadD
MPAQSASRPSRISPRFAVGLLIAAAAAWGGVFFWQSRNGPAWQHIQAGYELARRGDPIRAVQEWHTATQLDPNNAYAWQLIGQSYFSVQKWEPAREAFLQLLRIDPNRPHIHSLLAQCAQHLGDSDAAFKLAQEELKQNPNDASSLDICTAAAAARGEPREQNRLLRRLAQLQPTNIAYLSELAQALTAQHDMAEARSIADQIIRLAPNNADAYRLRGLAGFYADGSPQGQNQAQSDLLRSLTLQPGQYVCRLFLAKIYLRQNRVRDALSNLKEAVRLDAKNPDAYLNLADCYERTGQAAQAEVMRHKFQSLVAEADQFVTLKTRCDAHPEDFDLHLKVGVSALERGDLPTAAEYLHEAYALRPNDAQVQAALRQLVQRSKAGSASTAPTSSVPESSASPNAGGM